MSAPAHNPLASAAGRRAAKAETTFESRLPSAASLLTPRAARLLLRILLDAQRDEKEAA